MFVELRLSSSVAKEAYAQMCHIDDAPASKSADQTGCANRVVGARRARHGLNAQTRLSESQIEAIRRTYTGEVSTRSPPCHAKQDWTAILTILSSCGNTSLFHTASIIVPSTRTTSSAPSSGGRAVLATPETTFVML